MPTVTDTPIEAAWAHCNSPRCPGHNQEQVAAVRRETGRSYVEGGGNLPGNETSWVTFAFANPDDQACPHCGKAREVTDQPRKSYAPLSGHDPMGLLGAEPFDPRKQVELQNELRSKGVDPQVKALEDQNAELMERLAALEAEKEPETE